MIPVILNTLSDSAFIKPEIKPFTRLNIATFFFLYLLPSRVELFPSPEYGLPLYFDQKNVLEVMGVLWSLSFRDFASCIFNVLEGCFQIAAEGADIAYQVEEESNMKKWGDSVTNQHYLPQKSEAILDSWSSWTTNKFNHMIEGWQNSRKTIHPTQRIRKEKQTILVLSYTHF